MNSGILWNINVFLMFFSLRRNLCISVYMFIVILYSGAKGWSFHHFLLQNSRRCTGRARHFTSFNATRMRPGHRDKDERHVTCRLLWKDVHFTTSPEVRTFQEALLLSPGNSQINGDLMVRQSQVTSYHCFHGEPFFGLSFPSVQVARRKLRDDEAYQSEGVYENSHVSMFPCVQALMGVVLRPPEPNGTGEMFQKQSSILCVICVPSCMEIEMVVVDIVHWAAMLSCCWLIIWSMTCWRTWTHLKHSSIHFTAGLKQLADAPSIVTFPKLRSHEASWRYHYIIRYTNLRRLSCFFDDWGCCASPIWLHVQLPALHQLCNHMFCIGSLGWRNCLCFMHVYARPDVCQASPDWRG